MAHEVDSMLPVTIPAGSALDDAVSALEAAVSAVVRNDNPYSESWFKTLKFVPVFPERFGSLADARSFMADFVEGYNHHHHHTGIGLNTPADVHYGLAAAKAAERAVVLAAARSRHPERFATGQDPKILSIPTTAWINQPTDNTGIGLAAQHPPASSTLTSSALR